MRKLSATLSLLLSACAQTIPPTVAIRATTIVDVKDGSLRADHTVLIAGNRIVAVGPADEVRIPDDADVVEGARGFLIPGLWDMHVHSVGNVTVDIDVRSVANADWHFPLFLAHGVTGVRNMNDGTADGTLQQTTSVKRRLAAGNLRGPRLIANGPTLDGDPPLTSNPVVVRTAAEARAAVDELADNGADFIKVYENLSREAYFAIMDQARSHVFSPTPAVRQPSNGSRSHCSDTNADSTNDEIRLPARRRSRPIDETGWRKPLPWSGITTW